MGDENIRKLDVRGARGTEWESYETEILIESHYGVGVKPAARETPKNPQQ